MTPGKQTSEYTKALRAEILGAALSLGGGVTACVLGSYPAAIVCAAGVYLIAHTVGTYAASRGSVKSAALRPRVQNAPTGV